MADHRLRERGPGFRGNFDGAGDEELVVRHWGKRRTPNPPSQGSGVAGAQRPTPNREETPTHYFFFLMKLMSPLRSMRATWMSANSSVFASSRKSSSRSC